MRRYAVTFYNSELVNMNLNQHGKLLQSLLLCSVLTISPLSTFTLADTNTDVSNMIAEAEKLKSSNPEQAISLAYQALDLGEKNNNSSQQKNALLIIGLTYKTKKEYTKAKDIFLQALDIPENIKDDAVKARILMNFGDTHRFFNETQTAISYVEQAIAIAQQINDNGILVNAYNISGNIYKSNLDYAQAIKSYHASVKYALLLSSQKDLVKAYSNLAQTYKKHKDYNSSITYYLKTIDLVEKNPKTGNIIQLYSNLSDVYDKVKDTNLSMIYKRKALEMMEETGDPKKIISGYKQLADAYSRIDDYETSIELNQKALELVERNGDLQEIAIYLEYLSIDQRKLGRYTEALENAKRALAVQRSLNDNEHVANLILNISIIYRRLSSYDEALEYAIELIDIHENAKDMNGMASAYNATGLIYQNLTRTDEASRYYEQTLALPKDKIEPKYRAAALRALAEVFQNDNLYDDALRYAEEASELYEKIHSLAGAEAVNRTIGLIYRELGNNKKALKAFTLALEQSRELKDTWSEANSLIKIGELSVEDNPKNAIKLSTQGLALLEPLAAKSLIVDAYAVLMQAEEKLGNYQKAYVYAKEQYRLTREISKDEITQRVAELRIVRETEKREREIDSLKNEAQIKELELSRTSSELEILNSKNTISNLQLERERYTRIILIGLTVVVFLALALLYNRYRYSRQRQGILNEKNLQIESKNAKLEELNATKDRFFSIIAHDLRGPISSLVSLSEMLDTHFNSYTQDEVRSYIHAMHESSAQTYSLLDELLEWAMMQLRNTDPIPRMHSAMEICESVATTLAPIAKSKNIKINNKVRDQLPIYVDRNMINTVVRNLVANALKFTPHDGTIDLYAESDDRYTTIHIRDSGVGIKEEDLTNLFRIDKNVSRKGTDGETGTGFGLALCKDLVHKNGGEIFVSSKRNEGSDFYFQLPKSKIRGPYPSLAKSA